MDQCLIATTEYNKSLIHALSSKDVAFTRSVKDSFMKTHKVLVVGPCVNCDSCEKFVVMLLSLLSN